MRKVQRYASIFVVLAVVTMLSAVASPVQAAGGAEAGGDLHLQYAAAAIGLGMIVIGAALGIGKLAAALADGISRQPQAAAQITSAVNLPLFLLEGVAIIAEVVCLLVVLLK